MVPTVYIHKKMCMKKTKNYLFQILLKIIMLPKDYTVKRLYYILTTSPAGLVPTIPIDNCTFFVLPAKKTF